MDDAALAALVREVAKRELGEEDETREHALAQFRDWVVKNPNIRNCRTDDIFLLAFLRTSKFRIHRAEKMLPLFIGAYQKIRKWEGKMDCLEPTVEKFYTNRCFYESPFRDAQGRCIVIHSPGKTVIGEQSFTEFSRTILTMLYTLLNDPVNQVVGYVTIVDMANTGPAFITFCPPMEVFNFTKAMLQAVPFRRKELHIINVNNTMKIVLNIILSLHSKKMQARISIHDSFEELHKKVNPDLLPKEFGGKMPAEEMVALWKQKSLKYRKLCMEMSDMGLVGKKAATDAVVTGSFRKLTLD